MPVPDRTFVGFGFGAIQAGLFVYEAFRSGHFGRLVVAEVLPEVVSAVRLAGGCYRLNVATRTGIEVHEISGLEILNPREPADAAKLASALAQASEIATALPSVDYYDRGQPSVVDFLATALAEKARNDALPRCVVYTAENNNHAAEILEQACRQKLPAGPSLLSETGQFLNTVIGKMSGVVSDPSQIATEKLARITDALSNAFLVEEFNRILVSRIHLESFHRGIEVFIEKPDLLPFEEAKLYGHNAVHALLGYLAHRKRLSVMSEVSADPGMLALARAAFLGESGLPLIRKHQGVDPLFTPEGYRAYAEDLLQRMVNPFLRDRINRVIRDTPRKLQWDDRLIGTMRLALDAGVRPERFALGVAAALETLSPSYNTAEQLSTLWPVADQPPGRKRELVDLVRSAQKSLTKELN